MAHIELSLVPADAAPDALHRPLHVVGPAHHLDAWLETVSEAEEPCLLLDSGGVMLGVSPTCAALLGAGSPEDLLGRGLLEDVIDLIDFTAAQERLLDPQLERLPPLLALASGALARGLLRIRIGDLVRTLDAVSTPLRAHGQLVGSLTFFHRI
jgi:PAS domain-containing protein